MTNAVRILSALAAGLSALNVFILLLEGDVVPQLAIILIGAATVALNAAVASLLKPFDG